MDLDAICEVEWGQKINMARPRKARRIRFNPEVTYFKPRGVPLKELDEVEIGHDEMEAVKLKGLDRLSQIECARKMKISQSTFQRILSSANNKIAMALVEGKAIKIITKKSQ